MSGARILMPTECEHKAEAERLRAALEMTLDRVIELEAEREKLLRALAAFEGQRK